MDLTQAVTPPRRPRRVSPGPRRRPPADARFDLSPPPWVAQLFPDLPAGADTAARDASAGSSAPHVTVTDSPDFTLVTARVPGAAGLDSSAFQTRAADAYASLAEALQSRPHRHAVRFWNHIPDIRRRDDAGHDRYMVFNAGRFAACSTWFGGPASFDRMLPTASAVGHDGEDLVVHALAGNHPGVAVENPRQVPSYRYSRRFGPRPPCFARATVLPAAPAHGPLILVAGTASIRGEESAHVGDVRGQVRETFHNLAVLVEAASGAAGRTVAGAPRSPRTEHEGTTGPASFEALRQFRDLRVYYVRAGDKSVIARMVAAALPHLADVEYVRADLCRPDLLVEIEGTASVSPSPLPCTQGRGLG